jgi:hypothetical protein
VEIEAGKEQSMIGGEIRGGEVPLTVIRKRWITLVMPRDAFKGESRWVVDQVVLRVDVGFIIPIRFQHRLL